MKKEKKKSRKRRTQMTKEKILFVGQHPNNFTGNGNMLYECLRQVNKQKYDICAFVQGDVSLELSNPFNNNQPCSYISATTQNDSWGKQKLINLIALHDFDQIIFVGIDIWRYAEIYEHIDHLRAKKKFIWKALVPYDLIEMREDWLNWYSYPDHIFVYSEYGYNKLKKHLDSVSYFRPSVRFQDLLTYANKEEHDEVKTNLFSTITKDTTVFGFIGANQLRKNIMRMLYGFSLALQDRKEQDDLEDMILYMHMDTVKGLLNIEQIARDFKIPDAVIHHNGNSRKLFPQEMAVVYKALDVHLLFSLQEGLSWTVPESKLVGVPSLISDTTAHKDFIHPEVNRGILYAEPTEFDAFPLMTKEGPAYIATRAVSPENIAKTILFYMRNIKDKDKTWQFREAAAAYGKEWMNKCDDVSKILEYKANIKSKIGETV